MHFSWGWGLVSPPPLKKKAGFLPPQYQLPQPTHQISTPQKNGRRRPPKPPKPKVTTGNMGGYSPDFPQSSPQGILDNKKCRADNPNLPCVWPGWPKMPKSYWEARPKEKHRENGGGLQPRFFPKPLHNEVWKKNKSILLFPKVFGESSGVKSWLKGPLGPKFGRRRPPRPKVTIGKLGEFSA